MLQIGAALFDYKLSYKVNDATDWGSFILQIGVNVLQIEVAITN